MRFRQNELIKLRVWRIAVFNSLAHWLARGRRPPFQALREDRAFPGADCGPVERVHG